MVLLVVKAVSLRFLVQQRHISRAGAVFYDLLSNIHWFHLVFNRETLERLKMQRNIEYNKQFRITIWSK